MVKSSLILSLFFLVSFFVQAKSFSESPLSRISFGSCNKQNLPQPLWEVILKSQPQLWIWTGDAIYGDSANIEVLQKKYELQENHPDFQNFIKAKIPTIGTWDDHDYGMNDGNKTFSAKRESQKLFLDFIHEPATSSRRNQEGIYTAYTYGPPGKQIKVFLLDDRYHSDSPGPKSDLLGEKQWQWLESEMKSSKAQINIFISGIQFISDRHPYEKWANFPRSQKRLWKLMAQTQIPGVILISGDRHLAEISRLEPKESSLHYPLYEITSSGLTHTYSPLVAEENPHRISKVFSELHYGLMEIHWDKNPVTIDLQIRGKENQPALSLNLSLNELK